MKVAEEDGATPAPPGCPPSLVPPVCHAPAVAKAWTGENCFDVLRTALDTQHGTHRILQSYILHERGSHALQLGPAHACALWFAGTQCHFHGVDEPPKREREFDFGNWNPFRRADPALLQALSACMCAGSGGEPPQTKTNHIQRVRVRRVGPLGTSLKIHGCCGARRLAMR